jgi:hypothetical protein
MYGRALRTSRIQHRASDLSAALFPFPDARAGLQAGEPDENAADFAGALRPELAGLPEQVERAGRSVRVVRCAAAARTARAGERVPPERVDDLPVPTAGAAAPLVAGPSARFAGVLAQPAVDKSAWTVRADFPARVGLPPEAGRSQDSLAVPATGWRQAAGSS